ncbi:MAG: DUF4340 domain-containing protein [Planctomycetota bacterium]
MKEGTTTLIFGGVAALMLLLAWVFRPEAAMSEKAISAERVGENVFPDFTDPEVATSMEIVKYDDSLGLVDRFSVARDRESNVWTLPSNDGYPADAAEQLQKATSPLSDLEVLDVVSEVAGDHELYGVVDPDNDDITAGESGVGMLVRFRDKAENILADLIIGKQVPQSDELRYVRIPNEDAVYQVELDSSAFTTDFSDWIDKKLLGVRGLDINRVSVRDYILRDELMGRTLELKFDAEVTNAQNKWSVNKLTEYVENKPVESQMAADEEINSQYLNDLKTTVQNLEIIDVQRKPKGVAADLKVSESLLKDEESIDNLASQGFYVATMSGSTEIFSQGGETTIGTNEGVDYVLRFGEPTARLSSEATAGADGGLRRYLLVTAKVNENQFPIPKLDPLPETVEEMLAMERGETPGEQPQELPQLEEEDAPGAAGTEGSGNEETEGPDTAAENETEKPPAPKPPATETPAVEGAEQAEGDKAETPEPAAEVSQENAAESNTETPATEEGSTETPSPETPAEGKAAEDPKTEEPAATEEPASDEPKADPDDCGGFLQEETASAESNQEETTQEETATEAPAQEKEQTEAEASEAASTDDATAKEEPAAKTEAPAVQEGQTPPAGEATEGSEAKAPQAEGSKEAGEPGDAPEETQEELEERLEVLREDIAKANQRKLDERNEKIDAARKKVLELNARFSEWYYVVSDSEYQKLKVSREDLFKKRAGPPQNGLPGLPPGALNLPGGANLPFNPPQP